MQTKNQYLLNKLAEECIEVAHRALKQSRFGKDEIQPGQELTNKERLMDEYLDTLAVLEELIEIGEFDRMWSDDTVKILNKKKERIEEYYAYSKERGQVE